MTGSTENPGTTFEILNSTADDLVAVRAGRGTPEGYESFYQQLAQLTQEHGSIRIYEEALGWTASTFMSHLHGIVPDLRYGPKVTIRRYACIGDTVWAKLMYYLWLLITPIWPMAPHHMRYFSGNEREKAQAWLHSNEL